MIPKIIHYCWFGGNPLTELGERCIESWKKFFPDYEIKRWDESNYNVRKIPYIEQAYEAKKYAFVSDYARFDILYEYGGIYFDTDVEVIKDMSPIIERGAFAGVERSTDGASLAAGLGIASPAASDIFAEILESYKKDCFKLEDGSLNLTTVVTRVSDIFAKYGFNGKNEIQEVAEFTIYPAEYFAPKNYHTGILTITENTFTIHHYDSSWTTPIQKKYEKASQKLYSKFPKSIAKFLSLFPFLCWQLKDNGFKGVLKKVVRKIKR